MRRRFAYGHTALIFSAGVVFSASFSLAMLDPGDFFDLTGTIGTVSLLVLVYPLLLAALVARIAAAVLGQASFGLAFLLAFYWIGATLWIAGAYSCYTRHRWTGSGLLIVAACQTFAGQWVNASSHTGLGVVEHTLFSR